MKMFLNHEKCKQNTDGDVFGLFCVNFKCKFADVKSYVVFHKRTNPGENIREVINKQMIQKRLLMEDFKKFKQIKIKTKPK